MNTFVLELWDDECARCIFYSVKKENESENETNKFIEEYSKIPKYKDDLQNLLNYVIDIIGEDHGAIDILFNRYENEVTGLPLHGKVTLKEVVHHFPNFPLRLYALRLTEELVILFNGGVKDGPSNQESSLLPQWRESCEMARKIIRDWNEKLIEIDPISGKLVDYNGNYDIVIH